MAQVIRSPKQYDVCIIGSGAGGGMAAKILTEGGLNCALLEAGPNINPEKDFKMLMWPYELPHRGAGVGGAALENFSEFLAPNGAWTIDGEPYTSAPGANFQWFRSRVVGGRTNHWGRIALRFSPIDFKSGSRDGLGDDWPSVTRISLRITTKWKATSAFSVRKKTSPARRTAFFFLRPSRAAPS
jgi:choline dehydrogenase-like flavoprotein